MKKAKGARPAGLSEFQLPTAEEGRAIPVVFGKRRVLSPNAISPILDYGWYKVEDHDVTVAIYYFIGIHMGICQANVDGVKQIWFAEDCCWPTAGNPSVEASDSQTTANVEARMIWGGHEREGGVGGTVHIQYGGDAQTLDSYLESKLGSDQPAYRGFTGAIFVYLFYVGTWAGLKPVSFLVKRTDLLTDGSEMWYLAKAKIGDDDLNAIHIIYEMLTSTIIGLRKSVSLVGSSFTDAADTCYTEGFGLSCVWDWAPDDIDSMIKQIEEIIDGKLYIDYETGKFEIGLIRDDYDAGSLETFDESDFWVETMTNSSPGIIPSRVIVLWHDRVNLKKRPAFDDDIALLARQDGKGNVIELDYSAFVCDGDLANTIAARAQAVYSAQPKRFTLRALRTMAHLQETSVFKISYPELNITSMIVRCVSIDRGNLMNGECILEVVEDVFGQIYTAYGSPPAAGASEASGEEGTWPCDFDGWSEIVITTGPILFIEAYDYVIINDASTASMTLYEIQSDDPIELVDANAASMTLYEIQSDDSIGLVEDDTVSVI